MNVQWTSIPWVRRSLRIQQHAKASHLEEIKGPETLEAIYTHTGISQGEDSVRETVQKNYNLELTLFLMSLVRHSVYRSSLHTGFQLMDMGKT